MNYIVKIKNDALINAKVPFKYQLFFLLIADAAALEEDGLVYSDYNMNALYSKYKNNQEALDEAIEELVQEGLIQRITGDDHVNYIAVGTCNTDGVGRLFTDKKISSDVDSYTTKVTDAIASYIVDAEGLHKSMAKELKANFSNIAKLSPEQFTRTEFIQLFRNCYQAFFQEKCRAFMGKENGQMNQLIKLYEPEVLYKMIVAYISNSEKFNSKECSMNILTYKKDAIYALVHEKTKGVKSKSGLRTKQESDF